MSGERELTSTSADPFRNSNARTIASGTIRNVTRSTFGLSSLGAAPLVSKDAGFESTLASTDATWTFSSCPRAHCLRRPLQHYFVILSLTHESERPRSD